MIVAVATGGPSTAVVTPTVLAVAVLAARLDVVRPAWTNPHSDAVPAPLGPGCVVPAA